jgi:hypothetical protein
LVWRAIEAELACGLARKNEKFFLCLCAMEQKFQTVREQLSLGSDQIRKETKHYGRSNCDLVKQIKEKNS